MKDSSAVLSISSVSIVGSLLPQIKVVDVLSVNSVSFVGSLLPQMKVVEGAFIKPLLGLTKQQLRDYLRARGLTWMEDASNASRDYTRNKVRLDAMPMLAQIAGGEEALAKRLLTLAHQSAQLGSWIAHEVGDSMIKK